MRSDTLTVQEAANEASRAVATVRRWIRDKWLPSEQNPLTRRITIQREDLEKLLKEGPNREESL